LGPIVIWLSLEGAVNPNRPRLRMALIPAAAADGKQFAHRPLRQ
jgi:hypothetical protein